MSVQNTSAALALGALAFAGFAYAFDKGSEYTLRKLAEREAEEPGVVSRTLQEYNSNQ